MRKTSYVVTFVAVFVVLVIVRALGSPLCTALAHRCQRTSCLHVSPTGSPETRVLSQSQNLTP